MVFHIVVSVSSHFEIAGGGLNCSGCFFKPIEFYLLLLLLLLLFILFYFYLFLFFFLIFFFVISVMLFLIRIIILIQYLFNRNMFTSFIVTYPFFSLFSKLK